ncbi:metallophosphoesterase family protein [Pyrofollis japonicus]|uniref:metallophosphoesterase family protein n=1 Tax=Pyrofollis japonicus TaxID=3060460 RepID=UPI00295AF4DC|nr:metallophosphoesterase [Pyrofollis japonicus]
MRAKALYSILIMVLIAAPLLSGIAIAENTKGKIVEITIPKPELKAELAHGKILYPRLATPVFITSGGSFYLQLAEGVEPAKVFIDNGYGAFIECEFKQKSQNLYVVKVPGNAPKGLYDLIVVSKDNIAIGEPHAVYIGSPSDFEKLVIVHVTDRHFGVINSNGREAANYDLAADLVTLGLGNNTIIIDTGDTADTAKVGEYTESIETDYLVDKPLINIPGNHDHVGASRNFVVFRGPFNFTLSIYGLYRVVGIDSGGDGYIDKAQATWAYNVLTTSNEPIKIVLFHHPHFTHVFDNIPHSFKAATWQDLVNILLSKKPNSNYLYVYSSWVEGNKEAFELLTKAIFEAKSKATLVLSGHVHLDSYADVTKPDGTKIYYVVTTATGGSVRPGDYHGFRVIEVKAANGEVRILGDSAQPWSRHASFNLEKVDTALVKTSKAVTTILEITDPNIAALMKKTVVAVPIPMEWAGKTAKLYLQGLDNYDIRCTPLGCVLYAYTNTAPKLGEKYQATVFIAEDKQPPTIKLVKMRPKTPRIGRQVVLEFKVSDDAWGVESITAELSYDGKTLKITPAYSYGYVRIVVPPLKGVNEAKLTITVADASGKETTKTIEIKYRAQETTTVTPATKTTTTTTTTAQQVSTTTPKTTTTKTTTSTTTTTKPKTTATTPSETKPATTTSTVSPRQTKEEVTTTTGSNNAPIVVATIIVIAIVAFAIIVARKRS